MIDIDKESLMAFSEIPKWCEKRIGKRLHRSTIHRWRLRGARGAKLETIMIGGRRYTSIEALHRFFASSTTGDGSQKNTRFSQHFRHSSLEEAERCLDDEGI